MNNGKKYIFILIMLAALVFAVILIPQIDGGKFRRAEAATLVTEGVATWSSGKGLNVV